MAVIYSWLLKSGKIGYINNPDNLESEEPLIVSEELSSEKKKILEQWVNQLDLSTIEGQETYTRCFNRLTEKQKTSNTFLSPEQYMFIYENQGSLRGKDGKDGAPGKDGKDGKDGKPGKDGLNGQDGAPGKDGLKGERGEPGRNGKDGEPGKDGNSIEFIFCRTKDDKIKPENPKGDPNQPDSIPVGWSDNPQGVNLIEQVEWVSKRNTTSKGTWGEFSEPVIWAKWGKDGTDGDGVEYIFYQGINKPENPTPLKGGMFNISGNYQTDDWYPKELGWVDDSPELGPEPEKENIWVAMRHKSLNSNGEMEWGPFNNPVLWAHYGEKGEKGVKGDQGDSGILVKELFWIRNNSEGAPKDSEWNRGMQNPGGKWSNNNIDYVAQEDSTIWGIRGYFVSKDGVESFAPDYSPRWNGPYAVSGVAGKKPDFYINVYHLEDPDKADVPSPSVLIYDEKAINAELEKLGWFDVPNQIGEWLQCQGKVNSNGNIISWGKVQPLNGKNTDGKHYQQRCIIVKENIIPVFATDNDNPGDSWFNPETGLNFKGESIVTSERIAKLNPDEAMWQIQSWYGTKQGDPKATLVRLSPWGMLHKISGERGVAGKDGVDGQDGQGVEFVYYLQSGKYDKSINVFAPQKDPKPGMTEEYFGSSDKNGTEDKSIKWTDNPQGINEGNQVEWMSMRTIKPDGSKGDWSKPSIWSKWGEDGQDGDGIEYIYCLTENETAPDNPTPYIVPGDQSSGIDYENINADNVKYGDNEWVKDGWTDDPQSVTDIKPYEWVSIRKKSGNPHIWGAFSEPIIWAKWSKDGAPGKEGPRGPVGPEGPTGSQGPSGIPGVGIYLQYSIGTEKAVAKPEQWYDAVKEVTTDNPYIWIRQGKGVSLKETTWGVPFRAQGITGKEGTPGKAGQIIYPRGVYDPKEPYVCTDKKAPYVYDSSDKNYYVYNSGKAWEGLITPSEDVAKSNQDGTIPSWVKLEAFEALYAKVGIIGNGLIGSAVFNGDWMFSQQGKGETLSDGQIATYENFEPEKNNETWTPYGVNSKFHPSIAFNLKTGDVWLNGGKTYFNANGDGSLAGGKISWNKDGKLNISGDVTIGGPDLLSTVINDINNAKTVAETAAVNAENKLTEVNEAGQMQIENISSKGLQISGNLDQKGSEQKQIIEQAGQEKVNAAQECANAAQISAETAKKHEESTTSKIADIDYLKKTFGNGQTIMQGGVIMNEMMAVGEGSGKKFNIEAGINGSHYAGEDDDIIGQIDGIYAKLLYLGHEEKNIIKYTSLVKPVTKISVLVKEKYLNQENGKIYYTEEKITKDNVINIKLYDTGENVSNKDKERILIDPNFIDVVPEYIIFNDTNTGLEANRPYKGKMQNRIFRKIAITNSVAFFGNTISLFYERDTIDKVEQHGIFETTQYIEYLDKYNYNGVIYDRWNTIEDNAIAGNTGGINNIMPDGEAKYVLTKSIVKSIDLHNLSEGDVIASNVVLSEHNFNLSDIKCKNKLIFFGGVDNSKAKLEDSIKNSTTKIYENGKIETGNLIALNAKITSGKDESDSVRTINISDGGIQGKTNRLLDLSVSNEKFNSSLINLRKYSGFTPTKPIEIGTTFAPNIGYDTEGLVLGPNANEGTIELNNVIFYEHIYGIINKLNEPIYYKFIEVPDKQITVSWAWPGALYAEDPIDEYHYNITEHLRWEFPYGIKLGLFINNSYLTDIAEINGNISGETEIMPIKRIMLIKDKVTIRKTGIYSIKLYAPKVKITFLNLSNNEGQNRTTLINYKNDGIGSCQFEYFRVCLNGLDNLLFVTSKDLETNNCFDKFNGAILSKDSLFISRMTKSWNQEISSLLFNKDMFLTEFSNNNGNFAEEITEKGLKMYYSYGADSIPFAEFSGTKFEYKVGRYGILLDNDGLKIDLGTGYKKITIGQDGTIKAI